MYDQKTPIDTFLNATAARQPTPGGGSVTAMVGALATALGEMVINYSIGKKDLEVFEGELKPALAELTRARSIMMQLMAEDQSAYEALTAARKMPKDSPDREGHLNVALLACIRIPESIGATSVATLEICDRIINFVNYYLLSDLAVCADLAMATTRCAIYNVRVNLKSVTDPEDRRRIESTCSQILSRAGMLIQRISPRIWDRDGQGA
jgi:formiminotetrahydrofolate cyclodeaminase